MYLDLATQCALDAVKPQTLDLLGLDAVAEAKFKEDYVNASLMDLQEAMEAAWERGELGEAGEQLGLPMETST